MTLLMKLYGQQYSIRCAIIIIQFRQMMCWFVVFSNELKRKDNNDRRAERGETKQIQHKLSISKSSRFVLVQLTTDVRARWRVKM